MSWRGDDALYDEAVGPTPPSRYYYPRPDGDEERAVLARLTVLACEQIANGAPSRSPLPARVYGAGLGDLRAHLRPPRIRNRSRLTA